MKRLIGVGVGPGDPELVTVKAVRVLREADVVLVPVLAAPGPGPAAADPDPAAEPPARTPRPPTPEPGRAETIIRAYVAADRVKRLEFALNDTGGVTPRRAAAWQAAAAAVAEEFAAGAATVAFGTLGDPNLYSTFSYLAQTVLGLVPEVTVETVAGITAMQDLASRAGISLAEGTEPVTLVPLNGGVGALDQALARGGTVVGYKVGAAASPAPGVLRDRLQTAGRLDGAVIGARLGLAGELIAPAADLLRPAPAPAASPATEDIPDIPYLSTLIVPALRPPTPGAALSTGKLSRLNATSSRPQPAQCHIEPGQEPCPGGKNWAPWAKNRPQGTGVVRGGRAWRPGPADPPGRKSHRRRRHRDLGVEPGRPASASPRARKRRDRRLRQAPDGRRAALLRARGAAEPESRPRPLRRPLAVGRHPGAARAVRTPSAWTPRSCPGCPASPRWPPEFNAS